MRLLFTKMLEVLSLATGAGIYGAMRGYLAARRSNSHLRLFSAHAVVAAVCGFDIASRANERDPTWRISGRTSALISDCIETNSPKYFVQNVPLLIGTYALTFSIAGCLRKLST